MICSVFNGRSNKQERKAAQDNPLIKALGLAHYWQRLFDEGKYLSITEIAAAESMDVGQVSRIAKLAQLAPGIIDAVVAVGDVPPMESLFRRSLPTDWDAQKQELANYLPKEALPALPRNY